MAWIPTVVTAILGVVAAFSPQIQDVLSAHPAISVVLGAVYAIIKGLLPSPVAGK